MFFFTSSRPSISPVVHNFPTLANTWKFVGLRCWHSAAICGIGQFRSCVLGVHGSPPVSVGSSLLLFSKNFDEFLIDLTIKNLPEYLRIFPSIPEVVSTSQGSPDSGECRHAKCSYHNGLSASPMLV
jgi:hypothetical protein